MKRTISLALVLAFTCICLTSCISLNDFKLKGEISGEQFEYETPYGGYIRIYLSENGEAGWATSDYTSSSYDECNWEIKYTLSGAYVSIYGMDFEYDFDNETLTRKSDGLIFQKVN